MLLKKKKKERKKEKEKEKKSLIRRGLTQMVAIFSYKYCFALYTSDMITDLLKGTKIITIIIQLIFVVGILKRANI